MVMAADIGATASVAERIAALEKQTRDSTTTYTLPRETGPLPTAIPNRANALVSNRITLVSVSGSALNPVTSNATPIREGSILQDVTNKMGHEINSRESANRVPPKKNNKLVQKALAAVQHNRKTKKNTLAHDVCRKSPTSAMDFDSEFNDSMASTVVVHNRRDMSVRGKTCHDVSVDTSNSNINGRQRVCVTFSDISFSDTRQSCSFDSSFDTPVARNTRNIGNEDGDDFIINQRDYTKRDNMKNDDKAKENTVINYFDCFDINEIYGCFDVFRE